MPFSGIHAQQSGIDHSQSQHSSVPAARARTMDTDTTDDSRVSSAKHNAFDDSRVSRVSILQQSATQWSFQRPCLALVRSSLIDRTRLENVALHVN